MATVIASHPSDWTVADLLTQLGDIPPNRIRLVPTPGTATEEDLLDLLANHDHICELVDGVLVEKTMGFFESRLAVAIIVALEIYVSKHKLGIVLGEAGTLRILPEQIRIPDICFISWKKFPGGKLPTVQVPPVAPDLAVEVLSPSNSKGEMQRKLRDYFTAGVELVWYIEPATRTAKVYTSPEQYDTLDETQTLLGGNVVPGFELPLRTIFAEAETGQK
jgi:Uma2 family endonuclease